METLIKREIGFSYTPQSCLSLCWNEAAQGFSTFHFVKETQLLHARSTVDGHMDGRALAQSQIPLASFEECSASLLLAQLPWLCCTNLRGGEPARFPLNR